MPGTVTKPRTKECSLGLGPGMNFIFQRRSANALQLTVLELSETEFQ